MNSAPSTAPPTTQMLQRLSRNLRQLHLANDDYIGALIDAERVLELGNANASDHLARASLYQRLECPNAERFDLEMRCCSVTTRYNAYRLTERLGHLPPNAIVTLIADPLWERACPRWR